MTITGNNLDKVQKPESGIILTHIATSEKVSNNDCYEEVRLQVERNNFSDGTEMTVIGSNLKIVQKPELGKSLREVPRNSGSWLKEIFLILPAFFCIVYI